MKIKENSGMVGVDMVIAIIAVMIFSTLIITMISNIIMQNVKLKKDTLAIIYLTEIFENVAIEPYGNITQNKINNLVPQAAKDNYTVTMKVTTNFSDISNYQNIMKKVEATLTYQLEGKTYSCYMQRMKIKE